MKLRSLILAATILAFTPAAYAQTAPVANSGGGIQEAQQRFAEEQTANKAKFEQAQMDRQKRFDEMQAQRRAEFEARIRAWEAKRQERRAEFADRRQQWQQKQTSGGNVVASNNVASMGSTAPVATAANTAK